MDVHQMLLGGPSAFDYFLKGQSAQQNFNANQQQMQARNQEMQVRDQAMQQAAQMNPMLLEAQRVGIDLTKQNILGAKGREQRDADLQPGRLSAQDAELRSTEAGTEAKISSTKRLEDLAPLERAQMQQVIASGDQDLISGRQKIALNQLSLDNAREQKAQKESRERTLFGANAIDEFQSLSVQGKHKEAAAVIEAAKDQFKKQWGEEVPDELLTPDGMEKIKQEANLIRQSSAKGPSFEQVKGYPGMTFDASSGSFSADEKTMSHANKMKQAANKSDGILKGKDLLSVNDKISGLIKEPEKIVNSYSDLAALQGSNSSSDQLAAIFKFMKALDPTSVVRENEQEMVVKSSGLYESLGQYAEKLQTGKPLPEETFSNMVKTSRTLADEASIAARTSVDKYLDVMEDNLTGKSLKNLAKRVPTVREPKEKSDGAKRIKIDLSGAIIQ